MDAGKFSDPGGVHGHDGSLAEVISGEGVDLLGRILGHQAGTGRVEILEGRDGIAQVVGENDDRHVALKELLLVDCEVDRTVLKGVDDRRAEIDGGEVHALRLVAKLLAGSDHGRTTARTQREYRVDGRVLLHRRDHGVYY